MIDGKAHVEAAKLQPIDALRRRLIARARILLQHAGKRAALFGRNLFK